jgi:hypothetical protein
MQNWLNWCYQRTSSLNEVALAFFATNAPDLVHWTQTHVLGRLRPFRYCTKFDAKLAELAPLTPKLSKQTFVLIFRTNAPDPLHWNQNSCFGAFRTVSLLHESRCKTGRTGAINAQVR